MEALPLEAPLARHSLVDTRSPEEARQEIGRIFCPHFLSPTDRHAAGFHAVHRSARQSGSSLNFVAYGSQVDIDPGELKDFFLLQVPVTGAAIVRCGTSVAEARAGHTASLLSPTLPTQMRWSDGCQKLIVLVERQMMQRQCEQLAGRTAGIVEFETSVDLTTVAGRILLGHMRLMLEAIEADASGPYLARLGESMVSLLLTSLGHSQQALLTTPAAPGGSEVLGRAEEWIRTNVDRAFAVAEVADAAGTSLRSLQAGLQRHRGLTLTELIRDIRLERFRTLLVDPERRTTVTEAAHAAGLGHLGRAAAAYRARYGESPLETAVARRR